MGIEWSFRRLIASGVPEARSSRNVGTAYFAQNTNLVAEKIAVSRTRDSVRRASGFVQITITLI
jgi:hypothetical protein